VTIDKCIVLIAGVSAIIWLNVNFIRRMNRRDRDARAQRDARKNDDDQTPKA